MTEWLKIHVLLWNQYGRVAALWKGVLCVRWSVASSLQDQILARAWLHVPDNETGYWQFWLPGTLAHPWVTLAWHGRLETLGLPESSPCLCQNRRSKITKACFYASAEWAHALPFQANQIPLVSNHGTLGLMWSTFPQSASATGGQWYLPEGFVPSTGAYWRVVRNILWISCV